jgi:2-C-methyl-D-erythritol 2,4-cyclodiphosphate synthase
MTFRIGHGYDIHRLVAGRKCILGGVEIPCEVGLEGHSDADCLTHAICDALLGAAGLPDIGHFFPNTDERYRGANSLDLLREVTTRIRDEGYAVQNIDSTIVAERPKVLKHVPAMKEQLARAVGLPVSCIGIKATTHEGVGALGRGEAIAAHAVCLLQKY